MFIFEGEIPLITSFYVHSVAMRSGVVFFIHSLAQRTNQETSTPSKSPPILGDLTEKLQKPTAFRWFWYRGTRDEFFLAAAFIFLRTHQNLFTLWTSKIGYNKITPLTKSTDMSSLFVP